MVFSNSRLDYPGQCTKVKEFKLFRGQELSKNPEFSQKVLIVTKQLVQPLSMDPAVNLCTLLTRKGMDAQLIFISNRGIKSATFANLDIAKPIVLPRVTRIIRSPIAEVMEDSYHFKIWLSGLSKDYKAIISVGHLSILYYALLSRKVSREFQSTLFISFSSCSTYFDAVKASLPTISHQQLNLYYAESKVVEWADTFLSDSQHYLNWMPDHECETEKRNCYLQYIPSVLAHPLKEIPDSPNSVYHRLVFVIGEGCTTELNFCIDALTRLGHKEYVITFILFSKIPKRSLNLIRKLEINVGYQVTVEMLGRKSPDWESLISGTRLFIIPSIERVNSVFYTMIKNSGVSVLSNTLVRDPEGRQKDKFVMRSFVHNPEVIKEYLLAAIGRRTTNLDQEVTASQDAWVKLIGQAPSDRDEVDYKESVKISVCISHFNRGSLLLRAIRSITEQTYPCHEIIVVDDGSTDAHALEVLDTVETLSGDVKIRLIRQANLYVGASRNRGLAAATGEYILFMDDDNEAKSNELEVFAKCISVSNADILTCLPEVFSGETPSRSNINLQHALFVGANLSAGLFSNPFGDSNMIVKTKAVKEIGGFSEYFKVGREDQEFFVRAISHGLRLELVPQPLFYYRLNKVRIRHGHLGNYSGLARVAQSYIGGINLADAKIFRYAQGLSYANGPWGANIRLSEIKGRAVEFLRIYTARFPWVYSIVQRIRQHLG